jgi:hypothetical protein
MREQETNLASPLFIATNVGLSGVLHSLLKFPKIPSLHFEQILIHLKLGREGAGM